MNKDKNIATFFKASRVLLGLKQIEMAKHIGTTQATLSKIEKCILSPQVDIFFNLCNFLNCDPIKAKEFGVIYFNTDGKKYAYHLLKKYDQAQKKFEKSVIKSPQKQNFLSQFSSNGRDSSPVDILLIAYQKSIFLKKLDFFIKVLNKRNIPMEIVFLPQLLIKNEVLVEILNELYIEEILTSKCLYDLKRFYEQTHINHPLSRTSTKTVLRRIKILKLPSPLPFKTAA